MHFLLIEELFLYPAVKQLQTNANFFSENLEFQI